MEAGNPTIQLWASARAQYLIDVTVKKLWRSQLSFDSVDYRLVSAVPDTRRRPRSARSCSRRWPKPLANVRQHVSNAGLQCARFLARPEVFPS